MCAYVFCLFANSLQGAAAKKRTAQEAEAKKKARSAGTLWPSKYRLAFRDGEVGLL